MKKKYLIKKKHGHEMTIILHASFYYRVLALQSFISGGLYVCESTEV